MTATSASPTSAIYGIVIQLSFAASSGDQLRALVVIGINSHSASMMSVITRCARRGSCAGFTSRHHTTK